MLECLIEVATKAGLTVLVADPVRQM